MKPTLRQVRKAIDAADRLYSQLRYEPTNQGLYDQFRDMEKISRDLAISYCRKARKP